MPVLCRRGMKLADGLDAVELARAKAQMKAGLLMSLESTTRGASSMAQHMLIHGTPFDPADIVRQIDGGGRRRDRACRRRAAHGAADAGRARPDRPSSKDFDRHARHGSPRDGRAAEMAAQRSSLLPRLFVGPGRTVPARSASTCLCARRSASDYEEWARLARALARLPVAVGADLVGRRPGPRRLSRPHRPLCRGLAHRPGVQFLHLPRRTTALVGGVGLSNVRRGVAECGQPWLLGRRTPRRARAT